MKVEPHNITVRELVNGYEDNDEDGVVGFDGKLNIRPPFQREFIYKDKQREAVIDTVINGYPLNTMYWAVTADGFEIIDGQQRTVSICQYIDGAFSHKNRYFHNLQQDEQDAIYDYELMVYRCDGDDSEKLRWFEIVNIAGVPLEQQEIRNAVFAGPWTADAKRYFSKTQCAAWRLGNKYVAGSLDRQAYLETAISWINDGEVDDYMGIHQGDDSAEPLWAYFRSVINWAKATFPTYRKEMKGVPWGPLCNEFKHHDLSPAQLEAEVSRLMRDDDVSNRKGIYQYVLTGEEKHLNIRNFTDNQKRAAYERQEGICTICNKHFPIEDMEADHITPWHEGGKTEPDNCQMLCKEDNRAKGGR